MSDAPDVWVARWGLHGLQYVTHNLSIGVYSFDRFLGLILVMCWGGGRQPAEEGELLGMLAEPGP